VCKRRDHDSFVLPLVLADDQASTKEWQESVSKKRPLLRIAFALAAVVIIAAIVTRWWRWPWPRPRLPRRRPAPPAPPLALHGLTDAEASALRLEGQDNVIEFKPRRTQRQIWRENVYTIFNLSLIGLACVQVLLGQPLNALISIGTMALNIGINVGQEMLARRRLNDLQQATRPKPTVIREQRARSIDPSEIVRGDLLVVGPGDQFLVDGELAGEGQLMVDESAITGQGMWRTKRAGDKVYAGSFCVSGRGAYVAQKVGNERAIVARTTDAPAAATQLTPLERTVERILRILLVVVALFTGLLLSAYFRLDTGIPVETFNEVASMIFSLAPSSLFFMIIVTYATGTADLAKLGALVHRARSVESLAEATVICFAKAGILTGTHVDIHPTKTPLGGQEQMAESRLRQILGDYARSTAVDNLATRAVAEALEGSRRSTLEEAPFLTAYGWSGIAFNDHDLRGVYILGDPQVLESHLTAKPGETEDVEQTPAPLNAARKLIAPLGRLFKRGAETPPADEPEAVSPGHIEPLESDRKSDEDLEAVPASASDNGATTEEPNVREPFFRRFAQRARRLLQREEPEPVEQETSEDLTIPETVLTFAYRPEIVPLHDPQGMPQLPDRLIPLCELRYAERIRPEAIETIKAFAHTGVDIKVFTSDDPDRVASLFRQAGVDQDDDFPPITQAIISGHDLAASDQGDLVDSARENAIFGHVTPEQASQLVQTLRKGGETVAVVGDAVTDLPALRQANLAISSLTSTQAALSVADIVLLEDSLEALLKVLEKGQRIVHGLLDVLKLNLAQVSYLALLILAIQVIAFGFPRTSEQNTAIAVITVAIPSLGLSLWAVAGVLSSKNLGRTLLRFVGPAAITISAAALVVYLYFLDRTGEVAYAQLAVTYTSVSAGLLLVVFIKSPWGSMTVDGTDQRDWRPAALVLGLLVIFLLLPAIPLARQFLGLDWLRQPSDYLAVGLVLLAWALVLGLIWWIMRLASQGRMRRARQRLTTADPPAEHA
jgi:magnesium-transporting ATPase (P-type)